MRATMMLADYAQIADGKLFISGGGWSTCGPGPVMQPGATDGLPVQVNGHFEARRQPGMTPGTDINVPMSFNIVLHLTPNRRYSWVLDVDGQADDSWQL